MLNRRQSFYILFSTLTILLAGYMYSGFFFEVSDDAYLASMFEGNHIVGWMEPQGLLFNGGLSALLISLYQWTSSVPWYGLFLFTALMTSFGLFLKVILTDEPFIRALIISIFMSFSIFLPVLCLTGFTRVSILLTFAGILVVTVISPEIEEKKRRFVSLFFGLFLLYTAAMLRFDSFAATIALAAPFLVIRCLRSTKIIPFAVSIVLVGGLCWLYINSKVGEETLTRIGVFSELRDYDQGEKNNPSAVLRANKESLLWAINDLTSEYVNQIKVRRSTGEQLSRLKEVPSMAWKLIKRYSRWTSIGAAFLMILILAGFSNSPKKTLLEIFFQNVYGSLFIAVICVYFKDVSRVNFPLILVLLMLNYITLKGRLDWNFHLPGPIKLFTMFFVVAAMVFQVYYMKKLTRSREQDINKIHSGFLVTTSQKNPLLIADVKKYIRLLDWRIFSTNPHLKNILSLNGFTTISKDFTGSFEKKEVIQNLYRGDYFLAAKADEIDFIADLLNQRFKQHLRFTAIDSTEGLIIYKNDSSRPIVLP